MKFNLGDIFTYLIEAKKRYAAFQVIYVDDDTNKAVIVTLDYYQNTPANKENIDKLKPFWQDHHSWKGEYEYFIVRNVVSSECFFVRNTLPLLKLDELDEDILDDIDSVCSSWFQPLQISLQYKWLTYTEEYRKRYKLAQEQRIYYSADGTKHEGVGISKALGEMLTTIKTGDELDLYPCLGEICATENYDWLTPYLKKSTHITALEWTNHDQELIDMNVTGLLTLSVSTEGVKKIVLGNDIETLSFTDNSIPSDLKVVQAYPEQQLKLSLNNCIPTTNLSNLNVRSLWIRDLVEGDMEQIFSVFPNLTELRMWGKPGMLKNATALGKFQKLETLTLVDIFGFEKMIFQLLNNCLT